jgi:hypothetical protein
MAVYKKKKKIEKNDDALYIGIFNLNMGIICL